MNGPAPAVRDSGALGLRVGIVGGNGWIGRALVRALVAGGVVRPGELTLSCRSTPPDWLPGARWTHDNQALADASDVVVLSVRPRDFPGVRARAGDRLVVSVMAGVPLAAIAEATGARRIVRTLPNAAAEVGKSWTPWTASAETTDADRFVVRRILAACGTEDEVGGEAEIDYLTGLSGTGPAYPALLAAAMMQDAVARGLPEAVARRAVVGVLVAAGRLFEAADADPNAVVAEFVDYRGATAAGIEAMLAGGFRQAVGAGLAAALKETLKKTG
jgi:pyrroline-5-carboxylate reductase